MKPVPVRPKSLFQGMAGQLAWVSLLWLAALWVPASLREDWQREWRAELWQLGQKPVRMRSRRAFDRCSLMHGLITDAFWLRIDDFRGREQPDGRRGSARWCLQMLAWSCTACTVAECLLAGSWRSLVTAVSDHFLGCFIYVVIPGILVAIATSNLRPRRCDRKRSRLDQTGLAATSLAGFLPAHLRWNLFLAAKITLTLTWSFLLSANITLAAHMLIGHWADWVELLATALGVILSLRWALLNQERRCQHCLRMLSEPTRVGFASRNFLDWNGMELYCADGHGLLHVTEMEGSWCWYDLWVELDPTWHGLFSS